nr:two-component response regulator ARR11 isoform X1 [Ziziphus jujuba var. spinosa]
MCLKMDGNGMNFSVTKIVPKAANGLHILVVDNDTVSLMYLASMLEQYSFKVTTTELASVALSILREQKEQYKLVIANMNLPDIDNLAFLHLLLKKDIPVIQVMSSERNGNLAGKALAQGACYFLQKPICLEDLKFVWQHMYRKIRKPMKEVCEANIENKMNHGNDSRGIKIKETDNVSRAPEKGNMIKEPGGVSGRPRCQGIIIKEVNHATRPPNYEGGKEVGGVSGSATVCNLDGIQNRYMVTDPNGKKKQFEGHQVSLVNENHVKVVQNSCTKGSITTEQKKQEGLKTRRQIDDEEQQQQGKRTKVNSEQKSSQSLKTNEEEGERKDDSSSSNEKRSRVVWSPELHLKFTAAVSALGDKISSLSFDPEARPKPILELMNSPNITLRQVASHLQKYKSQVQKINETSTTDFLPVSKSTSSYSKAEFPSLLERPSALASPLGQRSLSFGGRGSTQFTAPKSLAQPGPSLSSVINNHRTSNLNSGQMDISRTLNLYPTNNNSNEVHIENHSMLQRSNQIRKTSSFNSNNFVNENMKEIQPYQIQGSVSQVSETNLPNLSYVIPEAASPCISADMSQLLNVPPYVNHAQEFAPDLAAPFNSQNQNQLSAGAMGRTDVLQSQPAQMTLGNATNIEKSPNDFFGGSQNVDPTPEQVAASGSNQNQSLLDYANLLKFLEDDLEYNCLDSAPDIGDIDHYCKWLEQTLHGKSKDPQ